MIMKIFRSFFLVLALVSAVAWTASGAEISPSPFPHDVHGVDKSMECSACHTMAKNGEPGFPSKKTCVECHKDGDVGFNGRPRSTSTSSSSIRFSHGKHGKLSCSECHYPGKSRAFTASPTGTCLTCHTAKNVSPACGDCHAARFKPGYHSGGFRMNHSRMEASTGNKASHGRDCGTCHERPACTACHQTMKPRSHNGFFRMRGHGLKATMDRKSCTTCHAESSCVQCHSQTKPMNHRGAWETTHGRTIPGGLTGSMGNCALCHKPSWCAGCHKK
jgi:hypothetical protein